MIKVEKEQGLIKQFAYILMGPACDSKKKQGEFTAGTTQHFIYTVKNFIEAKELVLSLWEQGVGAIELCGAFGRERALELIRLTEGKLPISYVVHEPEQDSLIEAFFRGQRIRRTRYLGVYYVGMIKKGGNYVFITNSKINTSSLSEK